MDAEFVFQYLRHAGVLDKHATPGDLSLLAAHGRNSNTIVRCQNNVSYIIKRPLVADARAQRMLRGEGKFYALLEQVDAARLLGKVIPRAVSITDDDAFVYEFIEGTSTLWQAYEESQSDFERAALGSAVGRALALFHRACGEVVACGAPPWIGSDPPAVFDLHRPALRALATFSAGTYRLIAAVQTRASICAALDEMRTAWTPTNIVHGDVRAGNVLVSKSDRGGEHPSVHLIDFETVQLGDPLWDLAGALQELLFFWISSMNANSSVPEMASTAKISLIAVRIGARSLIQAYADQRAGSRSQETFIERTVLFSAVRMLQSAYEYCAESDELPAHAVLLLQLAENILEDPRSAARSLYGIEIN